MNGPGLQPLGFELSKEKLISSQHQFEVCSLLSLKVDVSLSYTHNNRKWITVFYLMSPSSLCLCLCISSILQLSCCIMFLLSAALALAVAQRLTACLLTYGVDNCIPPLQSFLFLVSCVSSVTQLCGGCSILGSFQLSFCNPMNLAFPSCPRNFSVYMPCMPLSPEYKCNIHSVNPLLYRITIKTQPATLVSCIF